MSRRGVMRKAALGVGATAGVSAGASRMGVSPVGSAAAIPPLILAGAAGVAVGAAAGYLVKSNINPFTGDSNEDYAELAADSFKLQMRRNALAAKQADEAVLGTFENLLSSSANHVIAEAKKAAIDELNTADGTATSAKDAAQAEVDEFFKTQQKNLQSHVTAQGQKFLNWYSAAQSQSNVTFGEIFHADINDPYYPIGSVTATTFTITLVDGSTIEADSAKSVAPENGGESQFQIGVGKSYDYPVRVESVGSGEPPTTAFDIDRYRTLNNSIESQHSTIVSEMNTWVDGVASSYQSGDVSTTDLISPSDLLSDSQTQDGFSFAGASLASMGLQSSDFALDIELVDSGSVVEGAIYHSDDSIDSLQKDVEYDPSTDISGTVYIAYNVSDSTSGDLDGGTNTTDTTDTTEQNGGALVELNQPFIIRSITDGEGNTYNAANYESTNQQTYSQDIEDIQTELNQISEIKKQLEEQRDAAALDDGGGGGGFLSGGGGDIKTLGIVAGGAALAALLFGGNN